jgi:hypothetical protein
VTITKDTTIKWGDMTHVMAYKLDAKTTPVAIALTGKEGVEGFVPKASLK